NTVGSRNPKIRPPVAKNQIPFNQRTLALQRQVQRRADLNVCSDSTPVLIAVHGVARRGQKTVPSADIRARGGRIWRYVLDNNRSCKPRGRHAGSATLIEF